MKGPAKGAPRPEPDPRHALGRAGEDAVAAAYRADGFTIVARNLRTRHGELDLVARRGRLLVAVEVKTSRGHPAPERLVGPAELARRAAALRAVAASLGPPRGARLRVDVAAVRAGVTGPDALRIFPGDPLP